MVAMVPHHLHSISLGSEGSQLPYPPVAPCEVLDIGRETSVLEVEDSVGDGMQDSLKSGNTSDPAMETVEGPKIPPGQPYQEVVPDSEHKENKKISVGEVPSAI